MGYVLAVGLGGFVGAVSRYVLTGLVQKLFPQFPASGTLFVNVLGCLLIGFLMVIVVDQPTEPERVWMSHSLRLFLITGILGSLTTFSTFGYETVELLREDRIRLAVLNVLANLSLGFPAVWLGHTLARAVGY
ncbi:MAG: fluoride efflux transporter CrcB [Planctomycetaceae bacterium]|nr:fluoride efflux transporter CrcB [Planctomycetaceae bacterium]